MKKLNKGASDGSGANYKKIKRKREGKERKEKRRRKETKRKRKEEG